MEKGGLAARLKVAHHAADPHLPKAPSASAADATAPRVPASSPAPATDTEAADAGAGTPPAPPDVWFWDEMRAGLHGQVRRVWAPIGEKVEQRLQIESKWIYLVLAVNPVRGAVRAQWVANLKGPTVAPVLTEWFGTEPNAIVVWDGAPGHRNHTVQATGVRTVQLPPYSPALDPAERVFRAIRPEVEGLVVAWDAEEQTRPKASPRSGRTGVAWSDLVEARLVGPRHEAQRALGSRARRGACRVQFEHVARVTARRCARGGGDGVRPRALPARR